MSACTTSGDSTKACAVWRPKLTLYGTTQKKIANILVSWMGCSGEGGGGQTENLLGDLIVHQNVKVHQKNLFVMMVERMERQHRWHLGCHHAFCDTRYKSKINKINLFYSVGGDEWKLLAERFGLTQAQIRYLDKRTMNPCNATLHFIANRYPVTVGDLYSLLVDCELPTMADLL